MKHDFSAQFLRVLPPDLSFSEAWESLCYTLLDAEYNDRTLIRLRPPDKGVDILHRSARRAYQCKSHEKGAIGGAISAPESVKSLKAAFAERTALNWDSYAFASNASYTGTAHAAIMNEAARLGLRDDQIEFLGPEHWDKLCNKHPRLVAERFDYRVSVTKNRISKAFENQRYFPQYVSQYSSQIQGSELVLRIRNNRTPIVLEVPFSPDLTVKHLVDAVKDLLGISLEWTNYPDLGTSAGPSISLTRGRIAQQFPKKIGELMLHNDEELQFWITIVWRDRRTEDAADADKLILYRLHALQVENRDSLTYAARKDLTLKRSEEFIEAMIWNRVRTH